MKYKVGDKTLLGEIIEIDNQNKEFCYKIQMRGYISLFTESEIDAIIVKPKRNIDHLIELWESGKEDEAASIMADILAADGSTRRVMKHLVKPYSEPSRYPKLTPEELRAVKWLVDGKFQNIRKYDRHVESEIDNNVWLYTNLCPLVACLEKATWITESPINLRELLAAQEEINKDVG